MSIQTGFNDDVCMKIIKRIKRKIVRKINWIIDGYTVLENIADGYDEYGVEYWVLCKNGFDGRSWNIYSSCFESVQKYLKSIVDEGIVYNNVRYHLDDSIYRDIVSCNLSSIIRDNKKEKFNFKIRVLTENEYSERKENIKKINTLISSIKSKIREFDEKNREQAIYKLQQAQLQEAPDESKIDIYFTYSYLKYLEPRSSQFSNFENNLSLAPKSSINIFKRYMNCDILIDSMRDKFDI